MGYVIVGCVRIDRPNGRLDALTRMTESQVVAAQK